MASFTVTNDDVTQIASFRSVKELVAALCLDYVYRGMRSCSMFEIDWRAFWIDAARSLNEAMPQRFNDAWLERVLAAASSVAFMHDYLDEPGDDGDDDLDAEEAADDELAVDMLRPFFAEAAARSGPAAFKTLVSRIASRDAVDDDRVEAAIHKMLLKCLDPCEVAKNRRVFSVACEVVSGLLARGEPSQSCRLSLMRDPKGSYVGRLALVTSNLHSTLRRSVASFRKRSCSKPSQAGETGGGGTGGGTA